MARQSEVKAQIWRQGRGLTFMAPDFFDNFIVVVIFGSELPDNIRESVLGMLKERLEVGLPF